MFNIGIYRNRSEKRGVTEFQCKPAIVTNLLPWAFFLEPSLILNKDGAFQRTIGFRGPDRNMVILVTDGHLPYPFGHEVTGYETLDLDATLSRAKASGATILSKPVIADGRHSAMLQFPGGYIAEVHQQPHR